MCLDSETPSFENRPASTEDRKKEGYF